MNNLVLKDENFWEKTEEVIGPLPIYIKNAFQMQGMAQAFFFSILNESKLTAIESYIRSNKYSQLIPNNTNLLKNYYGSFYTDRQNFSFSIEDRSIIKKIIDLVNQKPKDFWMEKNIIEPVNKKRKREPSSLLNMLELSKFKNENKTPLGYRYDTNLKMVSTHIRLLGGPNLYSFLNYNFNIPCAQRVSNFIGETTDDVQEGSLRADALKRYLIDQKAPLKVWLAEDATALNNRIQYDSKNNLITGLILPKDDNSMPKVYSFKATSARVIENYFNTEKKASLLYCYMAQSNDPKIPPFTLLFFGTDNVMNYTDVLKRQMYITRELEKCGMEVMGFSGDGDTRIVKAMRTYCELGSTSFANENDRQKYSNVTGFQAKFVPKLICIQDPVHLENRKKNRLMKDSTTYPMGNYYASSTDLETLLKYCSKVSHQLNYSDLSLKDKMNFDTTIKLTHPRVQKLLSKFVFGSDATQIYLKLIFYSTQSMLSTKLNIPQRVYYMFYTIYYYRMWRDWLIKHPVYSQTTNFITINSYVCQEINGHGLLNLIFKCIEAKDFTHFYPWLYSSQSCEGQFRNLRAMSSTFSMVVNCTILEFKHRIKKLEMMAKVLAHDFGEDNINFPRTRFLNGSYEKQEIVFEELNKYKDSNEEITLDFLIQVLDDAKRTAFADCIALNMRVDILSADKIQLKFKKDNNDVIFLDEEIEEEEEEILEVEEEPNGAEENFDEDIIEPPIEPEELQIFVGHDDDADQFPECIDNRGRILPSDPLTCIRDRRGNVKTIRKSTLCWFHNNNRKLSADRLVRVRECNVPRNCDTIYPIIEMVQQLQIIYISEFCIFRMPEKDYYLIGQIKGFCNIKEATPKKRLYTKKFVEINEHNRLNIGCSAMWFAINHINKTLEVVPMQTHGYLEISNYHITIPPPIFVNGKKNVIKDDVYVEIRNLIPHITEF